MKKNDLKNYISKKVDELDSEVKNLKVDFEKTRLNIVAGREKNLKKAKNIKKRISQINTILTLKRLQETKQQ